MICQVHTEMCDNQSDSLNVKIDLYALLLLKGIELRCIFLDLDYSPKYKQPADENFILTVSVFSGY